MVKNYKSWYFEFNAHYLARNIESLSNFNYVQDIIEYKVNQTEEEKNILKNIKLKKSEFINQL